MMKALIGSVMIWVLFCLTSVMVGALEGLQEGMKAPSFSLKDLDGVEVALTQLKKAKFFVVVFWATWGDNSALELKRLEEFHQKYRERGLAVIGINVDNQTLSPEDIASVKKTVQELGLTFPILLDKGLVTFRNYGVMAVPSTVFLNQELTIKGLLASYPIAGREEFFELIEYSVGGASARKASVGQKAGYQPIPKALRYYNLAKTMEENGMGEMVEAHLKRSVESDPKFVPPLIMLGKLYIKLALTEEAVEYRGEAIVTTYRRKAQERYLQEATHYLQKAIEIESNNAPALAELGHIHFMGGRLGKAQAFLERALEADPSYTPAHYYLAAISLKRGHMQQAQDRVLAAQRLNPLDPMLYYTIAQAYEEKGMAREALQYYKKTLEIIWPTPE